MAVFHDRFGAFREEVKELLEKKQVRQVGGLLAASPMSSCMQSLVVLNALSLPHCTGL